MSVIIPTSEGELELSPADLGDDSVEIIKILKAERVQTHTWTQVAVEYIRQGKLQQAEKVLGDAIADETFKVGARGSAAASDRMVCLVTLAMLYLRLGSGPVDTNTAVTYHRLCEETLTKADAIRGGYYLTAAGRALSHMFKVKRESKAAAASSRRLNPHVDADLYSSARALFDTSARAFADESSRAPIDTLLGGGGMMVDAQLFTPAALGKACIAFQEGKYELARGLYAQVILSNPNAPASVRVGLGMCLYRLGHVDAALDAFTRALQMDHNNVEAMGCTAVILLHHAPSSSAGEYTTSATRQKAEREAQRLLERAYEIDSSNAMVLNHMADVYFKRWSPVSLSSLGGASGGGTLSVRAPLKTMVLEPNADPTSFLRPGEYIRIGPTIAVIANRPDAVTPSAILLKEPLVVTTEALEPVSTTQWLPLLRRDFRRSGTFARQASQHTNNPSLLAESLFLLARAEHAEGPSKYIDATEHYKRASELSPDFPLPWLGYGQMLLYREKASGRFDAALKQFNTVLAKYPSNVDALRMKAIVLSTKKDVSSGVDSTAQKEALSLFSKLTEIDPRDYDAHIRMADIHMSIPGQASTLEAIKCFDRAVKAYMSLKRVVPYQIFNNMGVLHHRLGNLEKADGWFTRAMVDAVPLVAPFEPVERRKSKEVVEAVMYSPECITLCFNVARLYESRRNYTMAMQRYQALVTKYPDYTACYVRLGCIQQTLGQFDTARQLFERALDKATTDNAKAEALLCIGMLQAEQGDIDTARKTFGDVPPEAGMTVDPFATICLGNIAYKQSSCDDDREWERQMRVAFNHFKTVMKFRSSNAFAANGLGIVLFERGQIQEARTVFSSIREALPDMNPASLNMAHTLLALGQLEQAAQLYRHCLKKTTGMKTNTHWLHVYIARCEFERGNYAACIKSMKHAIGVSPSDPRLWYNLAFALTEEGTRLVQLNPEERTVTHVEQAVKHFQEGARLFRWLHTQASAHVQAQGPYPFSVDGLLKLSEGANTRVDISQQHLANERRSQRQREAEAKERTLKLQRLREEEEENRRRKEEALRAELVLREDQARLVTEQLRELRKQTPSLAESVPSKVGAAADAVDDEELGGRSQPDVMAAIFGDSSDSDSSSSSASSSSSSSSSDSDSDDGAAAVASASKKRKPSKPTASSDSTVQAEARASVDDDEEVIGDGTSSAGASGTTKRARVLADSDSD